MLSFKWKIAGYTIAVLSAILTVLYFAAGFRFEIPVFAIVSSYREIKFLSTFSTNFADETILLGFISGFALIAFSKERKELDIYREIRVNALIKAVVIYTLFLIISVLFLYGSVFMGIAILNLVLPFVLYILIFNILKFRAQREP
ncbi:MAG TPA: hypothetical protein PKL65_00375 [Bacteroidales bacterium]|jgi:hypothetical protein|nr:hypothetical protein [Bacteroidales bacterium]HNR40659.1 hypothetical protein [Bacteroidales bacterium]HPM17711.1 hypothetical protein [Bacteroidales bacterium]